MLRRASRPADFAYSHRVEGYVKGWLRVFWQVGCRPPQLPPSLSDLSARRAVKLNCTRASHSRTSNWT